MKDQGLVIIVGPATDTVPRNCDSVMILRNGVVSEVRPILKEEFRPSTN
jgi:ABC-type polysaccharide/polyol phosphate transport system ATPase subunit